MIKIVGFLCILFIASSCSQDKTTIVKPQEELICGVLFFNPNSKVVGNWVYETHYENNVQMTYNTCQAQTLEINNDGTVELKKYGLISGNCIISEIDESALAPYDPLADIYINNDINNYAADGILKTFSFQNNYSKMIIEYTQQDPVTSLNVNYKFIYNRI